MNALNQIAQHLEIEASKITRCEEWAKVWFVVIQGKGARFVSKKVVKINLEGLCNDKGNMFEVSYGMFHQETVKQRIGESLGKITYSNCYVTPYYKIYKTPSGRSVKCVEKSFSNLYILDWTQEQENNCWKKYPDPETGKRLKT